MIFDCSRVVTLLISSLMDISNAFALIVLPVNLRPITYPPSVIVTQGKHILSSV